MSTATLDMNSRADTEHTLQYRALDTSAILGLVLGVLSVFTVLAAANSLEGSLLVAPIPLLGMVMSLRSLAKIRHEPEHYTGRAIAFLGLILSLTFLFGGVGYGGYVYATEVPEGYTRISFTAMKPNELQERSGLSVPPDIAELDGKKVFIKGYIRPDSVTVSRGIDRFLLVRDNNQCCFGDLSKINYFDQIEVDMAGTRRVNFSQRVFRMGGVLRVAPENRAKGPLAPVYSLEADYAD
jgi:hypothetical protein